MTQLASLPRPERFPASDFGARILMEQLEPRLLYSATPAADAIAQANNAFGFDLLQELSKSTPGNVFFSPYSAATALEMALQGAGGVTAAQMIQALHLPSSDIAQAGIQALFQLFQAAPSDSGYTLSTANRLWVNANFPLLESFITNSQNTFGAAPQTVDFSNPDSAANTINQWVSDQTNGKIPNLIPAYDLGPFTALVITNAIYFKGSWASAFSASDTQQAVFQIESTEAATVQMMQQVNYFGYYSQSGPNGFQAVDLPYQGNNLDMLVILPTDPTLDNFQSALTPDLFSQIASNLSLADVDVQFPQFKLNETINLNQPLQDLGIQTAFSQAADFSGMSQNPTQITEVIQKTFINVNETGTEAAAATGVVCEPTCVAGGPAPVPISFDADHPFIFAIRDEATNTILFLGRVTDPSNGAADYVTPPTATVQPIQFGPISGPIIVINNPPASVPPPVTPPAGQPVQPTRIIAVTPTRPSQSLNAVTQSITGSTLLQSSVGPFIAATGSTPFGNDLATLLD